jgi:hypothetical protein
MLKILSKSFIYQLMHNRVAFKIKGFDSIKMHGTTVKKKTLNNIYHWILKYVTKEMKGNEVSSSVIITHLNTMITSMKHS